MCANITFHIPTRDMGGKLHMTVFSERFSYHTAVCSHAPGMMHIRGMKNEISRSEGAHVPFAFLIGHCAIDTGHFTMQRLFPAVCVCAHESEPDKESKRERLQVRKTLSKSFFSLLRKCVTYQAAFSPVWEICGVCQTRGDVPSLSKRTHLFARSDIE